MAKDNSVLSQIANHSSLEEFASRSYRDLANWCDLNDWVGAASFFRKESKEELDHCLAFEEYACDRGETVKMKAQEAIQQPDSLLASFSSALFLEKSVLGALQVINTTAVLQHDGDVVRFLQKYLEIGVKSIKELTVIVTWLTRAGNDVAALQSIDRSLGN